MLAQALKLRTRVTSLRTWVLPWLPAPSGHQMSLGAFPGASGESIIVGVENVNTSVHCYACHEAAKHWARIILALFPPG